MLRKVEARGVERLPDRFLIVDSSSANLRFRKFFVKSIEFFIYSAELVFYRSYILLEVLDLEVLGWSRTRFSVVDVATRYL